MNISRIIKMSIEGDISLQSLRYLLNCHCECEHLDFKENLELNNEHNEISIVKDIIAIKNVGGGYIVLGVEDKTWNPIGLCKSLGFDSIFFKHLVQKISNLSITLDYVEHSLEIENEIRLFGIIHIRSTSKFNKLQQPSICKKSVRENEKWGIRYGDLYIRDGDETVRLTDITNLATILDDLQDKYQLAEQYESTIIPSQFEVDTGLYRLLPKEYNSFVGRNEILDKIKIAIEKDPRIWIINLYGPGGVGKSALATHVAYEYYQNKKFEAILQLSAKDRELFAGYGIRPLHPTLISLEDFVDRILYLFSHQECCKNDIDKKKTLAIELLSAFRTLIILDNMETVNDGRIMEFVREFPQEIKTKVLLTSRQRSREWEMPIKVPELSNFEIKEFITKRVSELDIDFPITNNSLIEKIETLSGGLPLAIQWILGDYVNNPNINNILHRVISNDSPLLEFSFRNSWNSMDSDAKEALAVLSIFSDAPTLQEWRIVLNWTIEKIERAKSTLIEYTFVTERTDPNTGNKIYIALPITLSFARMELNKLGNIGYEAKNRYDQYTNRLNLSIEQEHQAENLFSRFDANTDNKRKAILLTQIAEGQSSSLGFQEAEEYYKQALSIDPFSIYALVSYGKFKANFSDYGSAIELIHRALTKSSKKNAFYIYYNLADVHGQNKDFNLKIRYLQEALKYKSETSPYLYTIAQHSLGVALGKLNNHTEAIKLFDDIIARELSKPYGPSHSLVVAARTKKISLERSKLRNSKDFLDDILQKCKRFENIENIISELEHMKEE